jgi:hypothetical protein
MLTGYFNGLSAGGAIENAYERYVLGFGIQWRVNFEAHK